MSNFFSFIWLALLMAAIALSPRAAFASCNPVDLRAALGAPRDQEETGWCFAETTADLLSLTAGFRVSSMAVASDYLLSQSREVEASAGPELKAYLRQNRAILREIDEIRTDDPQRWRPQNIFSVERHPLPGGAELISHLGFFGLGGTEPGALVVANLRGLCPEANLPGGEGRYLAYAEELRLRWRKAEKLGERVNPEDILTRFLAEKCGSRYPFNYPLLPRYLSSADSLDGWLQRRKSNPSQAAREQALLVAELDRTLDQGYAAAIGYDYCEHAKPDPQSGECSDRALAPTRSPEPSVDHSAVAAARRWQNGSCQYFIRNSVGATCYFTKESLRARCEAANGGTWVSLAELTSLYSVMSIPLRR